MRASFVLLGSVLLFSSVRAAEPAAVSARELAGRLASAQEGTSYVRLSMAVSGGATKNALQLQIKQRRTAAAADLVYQVLWPKERKGEAVLLHREAGGGATGWLFLPPGKPRPLKPSELKEPLFGSDLSYEDAVENFFAWDSQALAGSETVNRVHCLILDSKPGEAQPSPYARVRSWIDGRRLVPLRIEKYAPAGHLAQRIETTRVANDDRGRPIPANLAVSRDGKSNSVTELDGSRIRHDVIYSDRDFTPQGMTELSVPHLGTQ